VSMALRSSPLEDSIPYKTVTKRRPREHKPELPVSYWRRPFAGGCTARTDTGDCCQQIVRFGPRLCYFHEKTAKGLIVPLGGSPFVTNGAPDRMPPPQQTRKRAQHD
jgi:hypothetical protein